MSDYLTEGWPLSPTSTIYMDGTAVYGVRRYGIPGATNVVLRCEHAELIREVVAERIEQAKAEALREAADQLDAYSPRDNPVPGDPRWTCDLGYYGEAAWLRARADRIEQGGQP